MSDVDERMEQLIVRMLDGELTADEQLELNRALARSAEVRALLEEYQVLDSLGRRTLDEALAGRTPCAPLLRVSAELPAPVQSSWRRNWMLYASAVAACLALAILLRTPARPAPTGSGSVVVTRSLPVQPLPTDPRMNAVPATWPGDSPVPGSDVGVFRVADMPAERLERTTNRDYILVPAADGRLYLLQVDRLRETRRPNPESRGAVTPDPI